MNKQLERLYSFIVDLDALIMQRDAIFKQLRSLQAEAAILRDGTISAYLQDHEETFEKNLAEVNQLDSFMRAADGRIQRVSGRKDYFEALGLLNEVKYLYNQVWTDKGREFAREHKEDDSLELLEKLVPDTYTSTIIFSP